MIQKENVHYQQMILYGIKLVCGIGVGIIIYHTIFKNTVKEREQTEQTKQTEQTHKEQTEQTEQKQKEQTEQSQNECVSICTAPSSLLCEALVDEYSLHRMFENIKASSIEYDRNVLNFHKKSLIHDVIHSMVVNNCSCVIVRSETHRVIGILDTMDIVSHIIENEYDPDTPICRYVKKLAFAYSTSSLFEVAQYLKSGFRYILVDVVGREKDTKDAQNSQNSQDSQNVKETSIVSQGSMLRYLWANKALMDKENVLLSYVREMSSEKSDTKITTVHSHESIFEAYDIMKKKNISSVPIIDENQNYLSIISISDVKKILLHSVTQFDRCISCQQFIDIFGARTLIQYDLEDTVDTVLRRMIQCDIHHVYRLNTNKPIGVVSYVDIIKALF